MWEFVIKYWLEVLFAAVVAAFGAAYRSLAKRLKVKSAEDTAIKEGLLAVLHDRLYNECTAWILRGYITVEALKNIEYLYSAYHALGGNGTGTELYNRVKALEIREE